MAYKKTDEIIGGKKAQQATPAVLSPIQQIIQAQAQADALKDFESESQRNMAAEILAKYNAGFSGAGKSIEPYRPSNYTGTPTGLLGAAQTTQHFKNEADRALDIYSANPTPQNYANAIRAAGQYGGMDYAKKAIANANPTPVTYGAAINAGNKTGGAAKMLEDKQQEYYDWDKTVRPSYMTQTDLQEIDAKLADPNISGAEKIKLLESRRILEEEYGYGWKPEDGEYYTSDAVLREALNEETRAHDRYFQLKTAYADIGLDNNPGLQAVLDKAAAEWEAASRRVEELGGTANRTAADRFFKTWGENFAGGVVNAVDVGTKLIQEQAYRWGDALRGVPKGERGLMVDKLGGQAQDYGDHLNNQTRLGERLMNAGAADRAMLNVGASQAKQTLIDIAMNAMDVGADAALTAAGTLIGLPNLGKARLALGAFGSSAYEAKERGADLTQQTIRGIASAAIETFTESIFDGLAGAYGAGTADTFVDNLVGRIAKSDAGRNALRLIFSSAGEGAEEVLSDLGMGVVDWVMFGDKLFGEGWNLEEMGYDFFIGATVGFLGSSVDAASGGYKGRNVASEFFANAKDAGLTFNEAMTAWNAATDVQTKAAKKWLKGRNDELAKITWQTGIEAGADAKTIAVAAKLSQGIGREVRFFNEAAGAVAVKNGYEKDGVIWINAQSVNPLAQVFSHELTHTLEGTEAYDVLWNTVKKELSDMGRDYELVSRAGIKKLYDDAGIELTDAELDREVMAQFAEKYLFTDEAKIEQFVRENRSGAARVWTWIKNTLRHVTGRSEKTFLEKAEKMYADAFKAAGDAVDAEVQNGNIQYMATDARGNVVSDNVTPKIVHEKLKDIFDGKYKGKTATIPVLQHTPQVFLDYCKIDGDRTFVMAASKAYNAMKSNTEKQHALGVEGLMEVIENLHTPEYIVFQRSGKNAGHYVAIVTANKGETVAAVDIGDYRSENNAVDGENGFYNVLITAFPADADYIDSIIESEDNDIVYDRSVDKEYEAPVYVAASETLMGVQNDASDKTVPQPAPDVKTEFSLSPAADADYMTAVESGDMETAQRMVDEAAKAAGYNIKAYHGTPNGTFTVFRDWQYFTENKWYADIYQNQGASSNGYKRTNYNPKTYSVFIKTDKLFDTRKAQDRRIFNNEFFGKWGNGTPLSDKGLPDWTDGYDLIEFFEEKGYDYDGMLIDEGATGGYGDDAISRGISFVIKNSAQIKSADPITYDDNGNIIPLSERFKSENDDIRYSLSPAPDKTETMSADDYMEQSMRTAAQERAERMRPKSRDEFKATPSLEKIGVKVANSVGIYRMAPQLRAQNDAAKKTIAKADSEIRKLEASAAEKAWAQGIVEGTFNQAETPRSMDRRKVEALVDWYRAKKGASNDVLAQQKATINENLDEVMDELFAESNNAKSPRMLILNERTPERNMRHIFGEDMGERINRVIFKPVQENEAERIRFVNRMYDEVRTFKDSKGKETELTKNERALVQKVIEGKAAAQIVAGMEAKASEGIKKAAEDIKNGLPVGEAGKNYGLDENDRKLAAKYGGWLTTQEELKSADSVKIENAVKKYTEMFDNFYDAINDFLVAHGYEPIGFIKGYVPHMQPENAHNSLVSALQNFGLNTDVQQLPASIAGQTANYKPNKRWNPYFLQRNSDVTNYDVATAYESYVDHLSEILYHTDDIMRARAAERYFRRTYAPEEINNAISQAQNLRYAPVKDKREYLKDVGEIKAGENLSDERVNKMMEEYIEKQYSKIKHTTKFGNLAMYLDNYANILAGKQSYSDRGDEYDGGRKLLNLGNGITRTFARAQVAGNLSSALNQVAQLPMIKTELGDRWYYQAIADFATGKLRKGTWAEESDFLTGKKGVDYLVVNGMDKAMEILFTPAQAVDGMLSTIAVRGKYLKEINAGKSHKEAMRAADNFGRSIMADRTKGSKPLAYEAKKPFSQMAHMFQIEAINTWEHISQDLPREIKQVEKEKGKTAAAATVANLLVKYLVSAFLTNRLTDDLYGGTPVPLDIGGLTMNFIASGNGLTTSEYWHTIIDNSFEKMGWNRVFDTERDKMKADEFDWDAAAEDTWYNISNDLPFVRNISGMLGWGDNTLPIPDIAGKGNAMINALKNDGFISMGNALAILEFAAEFMPGGRQLSKTARGIEAVVRGGKYTGYGENERLKFPVDSAFEKVQAILFGTNAIEANEAFYAEDKKTLTVNETKAYQAAVEAGDDSKTMYDLLQKLKKVEKSDDESKAFKQRGLILDSDLSDAGKYYVYYYTQASEDERALMDELDGADMGKVTRTLIGIKDAEKGAGKRNVLMNSGLTGDQKLTVYISRLASDEEVELITSIPKADGEKLVKTLVELKDYTKNKDKLGVIMKSGLTDKEKLAVYRNRISDERDDDIKAFKNAGMDIDEFMKVQQKYSEINDKELSASEKELQFISWLYSGKYNAKQREAIKETFAYYNMARANADKYEGMRAENISDANAMKVVKAITKVKPMSGEKSVKDWQNWEAICDLDLSSADKATAMRMYMTDDQAKKFDLATQYRVSADEYAGVMRAIDEQSKAKAKSKGSDTANLSQDELEAVLDSYRGNGTGVKSLFSSGLTSMQKAALWQLYNKSWKPYNNPYDKDTANAVYDALNAKKAATGSTLSGSTGSASSQLRKILGLE